MVYITGDTHAEFSRFNTKNFPEQKKMTKDDIVIILGDFGGVWNDCKKEKYWLDWLNNKPFTLLFIDGNHENFDRLKNDFSVIDFHRGKAHKIRDNIYHLMRGYIFDFEGKKFFVMGGASSHDIDDGILNPSDFENETDFKNIYNHWVKQNKIFRVNHFSWWEEELPNVKEMFFGIKNLKENNYKVDYVLTHCPPKEVCCWCGYYDTDRIILYFEELLKTGLSFQEWWSGHLHRDEYNIYRKYNIIYKDIIRIV